MNHTAPSSFASKIHHSQDGYRSKQLEKSFRNEMSQEDMERKWFADLLWKAFPDAQSENELSELVAEVLTTEKRPIHPRTVRNWLRCDNSPSFRYVMRILAMAGAEAIFQIIDAEEGL